MTTANVMRRGLTMSVAVLVAAGTVIASGSPAPAQTTTGKAQCVLPTFGPGSTYNPVIHPADFTANIDNPWFPLQPGLKWKYRGTKDGERAVDYVTVSTATKIVDGVQTRVVKDKLYLNGVLEERTSDYYTQDRCGNVWYFGEDTAELDPAGHVTSTEGTWHSGVHGAKPGVFMPARPAVGQKFRQEWWAGQAEDVFSVIGTNDTATVPYGTFHHVLRTREVTALEPGVVDNKLYVRGIGEILETSVKGPLERLVLVAFTR